VTVAAMALNSRKLLKSLIGKKLSQVQRYVFISDYAFYDPEICDQESDGPTEFRTVDGMVFHVVSNTEQMAIEFISVEELPSTSVRRRENGPLLVQPSFYALSGRLLCDRERVRS
jgi:hypothetical protein